MQVWSYRFEVFEVEDEEDGVRKLDGLGRQGWECFSVEARPSLLATQLRCWLKRGKQPVDPGQAEVA
jgi:hypothetical protein